MAETGQPGRLSRDDIRRIRREHPIVEVLQRVGVDLPIRTSRNDFMISCPHAGHDDSTPSCIIHTDTDQFYCFGCGAHGDVFSLITQLTGVRSLAAIAELLDTHRPISYAGSATARWSGTAVAVASCVERPQLNRTPLLRVLEVNDEAWRLLTAPPLVDNARAVLAGRGIDVAVIENQVGQPVAGHTPDQRGALIAQLLRRGFMPEEIVDGGWAVQRDGTLGERFRGRLLVPVRDADARVVGVVGRDVTSRARQRYLNTACTIAFSKGSLLYRSSLAPVFSGASIVVCEGALDALAIAASIARGAQPAPIVPVALSGTAMTTEQARLILALTPTPPTACPDGDRAGRTAGDKWQATFKAAGRDSRRVRLPEAHDPASWLQQHGQTGLNLFIEAHDQSLGDATCRVAPRPNREPEPRPEFQPIDL